MMHKPLIYLYSIVMTILCSFSTQGIILNLDEMMNEEYKGTISPLFRNLEECQIGGTHTYGNKTIFKEGDKKGELNPAILIINPDPAAHDSDNHNVLSILGSGFDRTLLSKLLDICEKFDVKFKRVYINNVTPILPVADDALEMISGPQKEMFNTQVAGQYQPALSIGDGVDLAFMHYALYVKNESEGWGEKSIYHYYHSLLKEDGVLLFKFAQFYDPILAFTKSFLTSSTQKRGGVILSEPIKVDLRLQEDRENPQKYITFTENADQILFDQIKSKLQNIGDRFIINSDEYTPPSTSEFPYPAGSRSLIYYETFLLKYCGFKNPLIYMGQFESHGYTSLFNDSNHPAYSLGMQVSKRDE